MGNFDNDAEYDSILRPAVVAAAATGPTIIALPLADLAAVGGVWGVMIGKIAEKNNVRLDKQAAVKFSIALLRSLAAQVARRKILLTVIAKIPGVGMVAGSGINAASNAVVTAWFGFAMIDLFEEGKVQDLEDYISFLVTELGPGGNRDKLARTGAFFKRLISRK